MLQTLVFYMLGIELHFGKELEQNLSLSPHFLWFELIIPHLEVNLLHYDVLGHLGSHTFSDFGSDWHPSS